MKGSRPFTQKEHESIVNHLTLEGGKHGIRNLMWYLVGIYTGNRISSILSLKIKDCYDSRGKVLDTLAIARKNMKGKTEGRVDLIPPPLKLAFEEYRVYLKRCETYHQQAYLIASQKPEKGGEFGAVKARQCGHILRLICEKLHITGKVSTHSMRKTFADNSFRLAGGDLQIVQKLLHHKNISSTMCYLEPDKDKITAIQLGMGFAEKIPCQNFLVLTEEKEDDIRDRYVP